MITLKYRNDYFSEKCKTITFKNGRKYQLFRLKNPGIIIVSLKQPKLVKFPYSYK